MILFSALFDADSVLLNLGINAVFHFLLTSSFFNALFSLDRFPGSLNVPRFPMRSRFSPFGFLPIRVSLRPHGFRSHVYWENRTEMGVFHTHTAERCLFRYIENWRATMKENALKELYIDELRDIYSAENQLTKALPKMAKAATSDELRAGFEEHLEQTKGHVERLERIFKELGEKPTGKKCKGMEGLVEEGNEIIKEDELEGEARDAGLISAAQRVEHYEIAAYGCVRTYANLLGESDAAKLLEQTLQEEKETDQKLTNLAEKINVEAEAEEGGESKNKGKAARA